MFKESVKCVSRKFQECFKNVLMKFCFTILLLHGSNHSYPSRRRACFPPDNKAQVQRGEGEGSDKVRPKTQVGHFFHGFPK